MTVNRRQSANAKQEVEALRAETESLRLQLAEAQETLAAIRSGAVDAVVVEGPEGPRVFTLQGAEHAYRVLVEQMREGALLLSKDGTIAYCNGRFAQFVNRPLEQVIGSRMVEWVAAEDAAALEGMLEAGAGRAEMALKTGAGGVEWASISAAALPDPVGGVCVVVYDLTERKRTEALVLQLNEELEKRVVERTAELHAARVAAEEARAAAEKANKAKSSFLAVLSHELRNPLNAVLAAAQMMQRDPGQDTDTQELIDIVHRNATLEARLIDDLLDMTRIERGKVELDRKRVDLETVLRRAVEVCTPEIEARKLHFGMDVLAEGLTVDADAARLQQVFWNLLNNAVKFTPVGGCVALRCRREGAEAVVEVEDSGEGIEPSAMGRIFNAFEQAERSITRQFGGLGLGLTICKGLVEMHGGRIEARSAGKGKGATFTVRLPLPGAGAGVSGEPGDAAADRGADSLRILLVEDHKDTANVMRKLLRLAGHAVELAHTIAAGLLLAGHGKFDLLISDLGLPDGSGLDLLRTLRSRGFDKPSIALTGYGQETDIQECRDAGFGEHLTKPVDVGRLSAAIARVTGAKGG